MPTITTKMCFTTKNLAIISYVVRGPMKRVIAVTGTNNVTISQK